MTSGEHRLAERSAARGWVKCHLGNFMLDLEWEVLPSQILTLFGPSGAGKTTLLRTIAGLIRPGEGHIEIGSEVVFDSGSQIWVPAHRRRVGLLTQSYHLFPHLSVADNIGYGLFHEVPNERRARIKVLVDAFHLNGLEGRRPHEISGGQQQRAALARALAPQPALLLLDEPFNSLDMELRRTLRNELRSSLRETRIPTVLVTHDIEEALSLGDVVQVIDNGRAAATGSPLEILGQPGQGRIARLVGVENLLHLQVISRQLQDGTMVCLGPPGESQDERLQLEVPLSDVVEGEWATVGIRASDIIMADAEPRGSSARNRLPGVVSDIQLRPPGYEVTLACRGASLKCHITGTSLNEMGIEPGDKLWAVFKASSCFLVREEAQENTIREEPPG